MATALGPFVGLGREHFGEIGEIAQLGAFGHLCEATGVGADHGQPQLAGRRPDGSEGGGVGHLRHLLASSSSLYAERLGAGRSNRLRLSIAMSGAGLCPMKRRASTKTTAGSTEPTERAPAMPAMTASFGRLR